MMLAAKGEIQADKSYRYTCGKCRGKGNSNGVICDWCFNLDLDKCREAIKTSQGQKYFSLLKAILSIVGKHIYDDVMAYKAANESGKIAIVDLGYITLRYGLNFKATIEWLEETHGLLSGTHSRIMESNFTDKQTGKRRKIKVSDIYDFAHEKYGEVELWRQEQVP